MRCVLSLTGMGNPTVRALPDDVLAHEPPGSVVLVWEQGGGRVRLVVTCEQLVALCDQVIEYTIVQEKTPDGAKPSDN